VKNLIKNILKEDDEWNWAKSNPWDYYFDDLQSDIGYKIWVANLSRSQIFNLLNVLSEYGYLTNKTKRANYDYDISALWFRGEGGLVRYVDYENEGVDWVDAEQYFDESENIEIVIDEVKDYL
jgi:hypothetical protein